MSKPEDIDEGLKAMMDAQVAGSNVPDAKADQLDEDLSKNVLGMAVGRVLRREDQDLTKLFPSTDARDAYLQKLVDDGYLEKKGVKVPRYNLLSKGEDFIASVEPSKTLDAEDQKLAEDKARLREMIRENKDTLADLIAINRLKQDIIHEEYELADEKTTALETAVKEHLETAKNLQAVYKKFESEPSSVEVLKSGVLDSELQDLIGLQHKINEVLISLSDSDPVKGTLKQQLKEIEDILTEYSRDYGFLIPGRDDEKIVQLIDDEVKKYQEGLAELEDMVDKYHDAAETRDLDLSKDLFNKIDACLDKCDEANIAIRSKERNLTKQKRSELSAVLRTPRAKKRDLEGIIYDIDKVTKIESEVGPFREPIDVKLAQYPPLLNEFELAIDRYEDAIRSNDANGLIIARGDDGMGGELGALWTKIDELDANISAVCGRRKREIIKSDHPTWSSYETNRENLKDRLRKIDADFKKRDLVLNSTIKYKVAGALRIAGDSVARFSSALEDTKTPKRLRLEVMDDAFKTAMGIARDLILRKLTIRPETKTDYDHLLAILTTTLKDDLDDPIKRKQIGETLARFISNLNSDQEAFFEDVLSPAEQRLKDKQSADEEKINKFIEPLDDKDLERDDFKRFFLRFDSARNPGSPLEKVPPDEAEKRFESAKEAFNTLQKAILIFSRFAKDRVEQGVGEKPEAADFLAANADLEKMVIENPVQVNSMIEKMEMTPNIEEQIARLDNAIESELSQDQLEQLEKDLDEDRAQLTAEYKSLDAKSDLQYKETLFESAVRKRGFKERLASFVGLPSSVESHIKTKYGLTLKQAAAQLDQAKGETEAFNKQLRATLDGLTEVTEQYNQIRQRIVDLKTAQEQRGKLENQFAQLKADVIKNSRIFKNVARIAVQGINQDILGSLSADSSLKGFVSVADQIKDLERASANIDYMNVPEVGKVYEKLYGQLKKAVESSIVKAAKEQAFDTGVIADLEKTIKTYGDRAKLIVNEVLNKHMKTVSSKNRNKAMILRAIQLRLNKKS